jgi:hypothetical protein
MVAVSAPGMTGRSLRVVAPADAAIASLCARRRCFTALTGRDVGFFSSSSFIFIFALSRWHSLSALVHLIKLLQRKSVPFLGLDLRYQLPRMWASMRWPFTRKQTGYSTGH